MSSYEWNGGDDTYPMIILGIMLLGAFLFVSWINQPTNLMDDFCIDNGFEEATDYTTKNNTLIECDDIEIFNTIRIRECGEFDKWGECRYMKTKEYINSEEGEQ